MGLSTELLNGIGGGVGVGEGAIGAFTGTAFALVSVFKAMHRIDGGEVGLRTFGGRPRMRNGHYVIVQPGLRWSIPYTHSIERMDTRDQPTAVNELFIDRQQPDEQYRVLASFLWRVSPEGDNPGFARYRVNKIEEVVPDYCFSALRTVMKDIGRNDMANEQAVEAGVREICDEQLAYYGSEIRKLNLHSVSRSIGSMLRPATITPVNGTPAATLAVAAGAIPEAYAD